MRVAAAAALAVAAALACGGAWSAPRPSARLVDRGSAPVAGRTWAATVRVTGSRAKPAILARRGRRIVRARVQRRRTATYRVALVFPSPGTWTLRARIGSHRVGLGRILVAPAELLLAQPGQVLARSDGSLLVTERVSRDRILRVERSGAARVLARGLDEPFGLANGRDGSVLASASGGIYRLPARRVAAVEAGPIAESPAGDIFYAGRTEVGRVDPGGNVHRYAVDVEIPHALVLSADRSLVITDSGHNRVLRLDPATGSSTVAAAGLATPLGLVEEPGGALLVAEYGAGRLTRIAPGGAWTTVVAGLDKPYALARTTGGSVYVVEAGELSRPSGRLKRVAPDGTVTPVRLRLAGP